MIAQAVGIVCGGAHLKKKKKVNIFKVPDSYNSCYHMSDKFLLPRSRMTIVKSAAGL